MHPVVMKVVDISTQILLKSLVLVLSLFLCLQMGCGTELSVDA